MTSRIGTKGQVVIPKAIRDELGLRPGSEVAFEREGRTVRLVPADVEAFLSLRGRFAGSGLTEALLEDRRREPR